jgi:hypothetical protein
LDLIDYLSIESKNHSNQQKVEQVISDIKHTEEQYNYDFIFFTTKDELIKEKFIPGFRKKLKLLNPNVKFNMIIAINIK